MSVRMRSDGPAVPEITGSRIADAANRKITNLPDANKCLVREYRKGWELNG